MTFRKPVFILTAFLALTACSRDPEALKQRLFELGNKYFDRGEYREASIIYRKALQQDRRFGEAYYRLALAELELGRMNAAGGALQRAFELEPGNSDAFGRLAELYLAVLTQPAASKQVLADLIQLTERAEEHDVNSFEVTRIKGHIALHQNEPGKAITLFQEAERLKPLDPKVTLPLIAALIGQRRAEEAESLAKALIEKDKSIGRAYDLLYLLYAMQNRIGEAEAILHARSENNLGNAKYLIDLAAHYLRVGKRAEMEGVLDRLTGQPEDYPDGHELVGDFHLRAGNGDLAIQHYRKGIDLSPNRERQYRHRIVEALAALGRWEEAVRMAEELVKEDANDPQARSLRGALRLHSGDQEQIQSAVEDLQAAISRAPDNAVLRHRLGEALVANGDLFNAGAQFREALRLQPSYFQPSYALMNLHLSRNEFTQAVVQAEKVLEQDPLNPLARLLRAAAWIGLREYERARAEFRALSERGGPHGRNARFYLARLDLIEKKYGQAEERLRSLAQSDPADWRPLQGLVEVQMAQGRPEKALQLLETELEKAPEQVYLRLALAELAMVLRDFQRASTELNSILARDPNHAAAHARLGEIHLGQGDMDTARAHLQRATQASPSPPEAFLNLGAILAGEGKLQEARSHFEQVLKLSPDHPAAMNNLAYILAETETDLDQALTYAQRAKARDPDNADFTDTLGWVYAKRGLNEDAIDVLGKIVAQNPSRASYRYHLAVALSQGGDTDQAKKHLEEALRNKPSTEEEARIRSLLQKTGP